MGKFSTTNPLLSSSRIAGIEQAEMQNGVASRDASDVMTLKGTSRKTFFLVLLTVITAFFTISSIDFAVSMSSSSVFVALILGLIAFLAMSFKVALSPVLAPIYAICEGYALGYISAFAEMKFPGIAAQAGLITIVDAAVMFFCFSFGIIRVTEKFKAIVITAGIALAMFYLVRMFMGLFDAVPAFMAFGGGFSIAINVFAVVISSLFLLLDFSNIASAHGRVSKSYEWYFGASVLSTLVWMYIEILRLLLQLANRE